MNWPALLSLPAARRLALAAPAAAGYQLNVKTTGYPAGTYILSFTVSGDPTVHTAQFVIS